MAHFHNNALIGASGQGGVYEIEQSLRFKSGNSNLRKAFSSAGDEQTWTLSVWIKYPICSANHAVILSAGPQGSYDNIRISTTGHTPNNAFSWYLSLIHI